jgi:uncharacterized protein
MQIDSPFHFDARGRTAPTDDEDHIRDMLELLIFTNPGERVNRPDFGCGLQQLVHAPNSPELAAALQFTIQAAIQRELGDLLDLSDLEVSAIGNTLLALVEYRIVRTGALQSARFERSAP